MMIVYTYVMSCSWVAGAHVASQAHMRIDTVASH